MAVLEIKPYPDPVLRQRALPVTTFDNALSRLIDNMIETLYAAPGLGLAAPQVGVSLRLFVYDLSVTEGRHPLVVLINPELVEKNGRESAEEGCLSILEYREWIKRASRVVVRGLDRGGKEVTLEAEGFHARVLQHEMDHLDGMLIVDRIGRLKRDIFARKFRKRVKLGG